MTLLVLWTGSALLLAAAVLLADWRHRDPRPVCVSCDEPRLPKYLADGVCLVCRAAAPPRTQVAAELVVDLDPRPVRHRAAARRAQHRSDLERQLAHLDALRRDVAGQLAANDIATAEVLRPRPGGAR